MHTASGAVLAVEPFLASLFDRVSVKLSDTSVSLGVTAEPVPGGYPFSQAAAMWVLCLSLVCN